MILLSTAAEIERADKDMAIMAVIFICIALWCAMSTLTKFCKELDEETERVVEKNRKEFEDYRTECLQKVKNLIIHTHDNHQSRILESKEDDR
jgi:hypothetical protein